MDPKSISDIQACGTSLGGGAFGEAWRVGDQVFKVYKMNRQGAALMGVKSMSAAEMRTAASEWNYFYGRAYGGQFRRLASATVIRLESGECVLRTPFVDGTEMPADVYARSPQKELVVQTLKQIQRQIGDNSAANIRILDGKPVIIDFDCVTFKNSDAQDAALKMFGF